MGANKHIEDNHFKKQLSLIVASSLTPERPYKPQTEPNPLLLFQSLRQAVVSPKKTKLRAKTSAEIAHKSQEEV